MQNIFSLLFYVKRSKADSNGKANVYFRITVDGKRAELSIRRKVAIDKWNAKAGRVKGFTKEAQELNRYIDIISNKIYKIHQGLVEENKIISSQKIRDIYQGKDEKPKMLLEIFKDHNTKLEKLIGKEFSLGTYKRYETTKKHLEEFIKSEYNSDDKPVKEIDRKFINGLEYFLKTEKKCSHNTAIKYVANFKKIVRIAYANDWINKDPFYNWKVQLKTIDREFLTKEEIQKMVEKEMHTPRLDQVRDIFIFCCFTGLAYADVQKLSEGDLVIGIDGGRWIKTKRTKTDTRSNIPLLPTSEAILKKYSDHSNSGKLLPVLSNQKMNAYLKEIADLSGIAKNLTFHLARHTFATTVTLSNGVPIESVSKMLGHKSLKTTQHYAKILDLKVSEDMQVLRDKLINTESESIVKAK